MKVRFKSKVTRGFSFSPLRDSVFAASRVSHAEENEEKPLGPEELPLYTVLEARTENQINLDT